MTVAEITYPSDEEIIEAARDMYAAPSDDDIEIDDDPELSHADYGCWVQAWVFVRYNECEGFEDVEFGEV